MASIPADSPHGRGASNGMPSEEGAAALASRNPYNALQQQQQQQQQPQEDPFMSTPTSNHQQQQRFSPFDSQIFALGSSASPEQTKRALEAHLAETERRIQDASRLGTTLVQQRKELSRSLKEVDQQQKEGEIGPELKQKLLEIEKEYHEVGRESARAMLGPKSIGAEGTGASPFNLDGRGRPASPSKFATEATDSPSKLNVPSQRRARNQPSNGIHDSEFYAEISTSLLSQVRNLQAIIAERDDNLKTIQLDKSRLEAEAEGFAQRLRSLDESEQRYKDENWSLETQTHDLIAANKEAAAREQRLQQTMSLLSADKAAAQKELDEYRQVKEKLSEDHSAAVKHHEAELLGLRKDLTGRESERSTMQKRIDELNAQNQELAQAVAGRMRQQAATPTGDFSEDNLDAMADITTPEGSPPPSPSKGTPRHSMLESETLKSSLHHAHRMIQNLKGNIHREKTEKIELKRMLQEARDEIDIRRTEGGSSGGAAGGAAGGAGKKAQPRSDKDSFKKPANPTLLGVGRKSKNEVILDEAGWEDHDAENSPGRTADGLRARGVDPQIRTESRASETSDAFETANERDMSTTEDDSFQTGAESLDGGSSDELTETEGGVTRGGTVRVKRASEQPVLKQAGNRNSFLSTASTSDEDQENNSSVKTPTSMPQGQRYRLKMNRGGVARRSRASNDDSPASFKDSPASFASPNSQGTPQGPSLFSELGDFNGDEDEMDGTPSKGSILSRGSTPGSRSGTARQYQQAASSPVPPLPKVAMTDSGMMTEPWDAVGALPQVPAFSRVSMAGSSMDSGNLADQEQSRSNSRMDAPQSPRSTVPAEVHAAMLGGNRQESVSTQASLTPWSVDSEGRRSSTPGWTPPRQSTPYPMSMAPIGASDTEPMPAVPQARQTTPLQVSGIYSQTTEPVQPSQPSIQGDVPRPPPQSLGYSLIYAQATEPVAPTVVEPTREATPSKAAIVAAQTDAESDSTPTRVSSRRSATPEAAKTGFLGSVFGWRKSQQATEPQIAEDHTSQEGPPVEPTDEGSNQRGVPFQDISPNVGHRTHDSKDATPATNRRPPVDMMDQSAQTTLSADQINNLMKDESKRWGALQEARRARPTSPTLKTAHIGVIPPVTLRSNKSQESIGQGSVGRARSRISETNINRDEVAMSKAFKRPASQGSLRNSSGNHPPLPPDHKQAIAAAAQRVSTDQTGLMGPPNIPASAYPKTTSPQRRPVTPSSPYAQSPSTRGGTTPRAARHSTANSGMTSPVGTRRSSVSSFASELDERFNIRTDDVPMPQGLQGPGTDPRMIQAITQTMIGEYLWKYTRKAGRSQTSDKRHRRFFWVHPYTKTLYWSDRDPAVGGRAELKAKSVAIEAVRVVTDDNPMPPGLHRKSIVIVTPGRSVKFTATTGQRHETWFNALSYLLLRTGPDGGAATSTHGGYDSATDGHYTADDLDEFNPGGSRRARSTRHGAASIASYGSRPHTRQQSVSRGSVRRATGNYNHSVDIPNLSTSSRASQQPSLNAAQYSSAARQSGTQGSISRLSSIFRPGSTLRGSFSSRRSRHSVKSSATGATGERGSIYGGDVVSDAHDSAEDLREQLAREDRESDRLENVRACCDGRHDVGHLSMSKKGGRHSHSHSHATTGTAGTAGTADGSRGGRFSTAGSVASRHSTRAQTPVTANERERGEEVHELGAGNGSGRG